MESYDELNQQAVKLLHGLNKKKMKKAIEILKLISSEDGLKLHSPDGTLGNCFTNIPNSCLTVIVHDSDLGPRDDTDIVIGTPYRIKINKRENKPVEVFAPNKKYGIINEEKSRRLGIRPKFFRIEIFILLQFGVSQIPTVHSVFYSYYCA